MDAQTTPVADETTPTVKAPSPEVQRRMAARRALMLKAVDAAQPGVEWWPALAPLTKAERRFVRAQLGMKP